jgi:hypothetical protein
MNLFKKLAFLASALALSASAMAVDIDGVRVEDTVDVGGSKLQLNGAGIRTKVIFKVYVAGVYLPQKTTSAQDAIAGAGPKRIALTFLRNLEGSDMSKAFVEGIEANTTAAELAKLQPNIARVNALFAAHKELKKGESVLIDLVPGTGVVFTINGKAEGEPIKDADFYGALMRIWFGEKPADNKLKTALLGGK